MILIHGLFKTLGRVKETAQQEMVTCQGLLIAGSHYYCGPAGTRRRSEFPALEKKTVMEEESWPDRACASRSEATSKAVASRRGVKVGE